MENFTLFNNQPNIAQSRGEFQQYFPDSNQMIYYNHKRNDISSYQQKAPFLRYASSLLEIGTQQQQKNQHLQIYQQSELINPPQSLLQKYQSLKKDNNSCENLSCESINSKRVIKNVNSGDKIRLQKGIKRLAVFIQNKKKRINKIINSEQNNKQPQSLIDILARSSVQNLNQFDIIINNDDNSDKNKNTIDKNNIENNKKDKHKYILKDSFNKIKLLWIKSNQKLKLTPSKPILPIDKKRNNQQQINRINHYNNNISNSYNNNNLINNSNNNNNLFITPIKQLSINKKQGTQHIVGSLTFKMLVLQSQCFRTIKQHNLLSKFTLFIQFIHNIIIKHTFHSLNQYRFHHNYQIHNDDHDKLDSKILTLSKSKSSLSKLKVHQINSQKKIKIKKFNSQQDQSLTENQHYHQRIINSQILQNFDFTQYQSKINQDDLISTDKKMEFNNKLKKKNTKDSNSQAQTVNSKRSFQSQYQFAQGVSSKVSTCKKPISVKNFTHDDQQDQQIPTQKFINLKRKKSQQKFQYQRNLFIQPIKQSKQLVQFRKQQRRYLNIRTNLFQLPLQFQMSSKQLNYKQIIKKQQMSKIYHLMPQGLINNQPIQDQKDSLIMNLNMMTFPKISKHTHSQKKIDTYKQFIQKQQKKKRNKNHKDHQKLQQYYLNINATKFDQNIQSYSKINKNEQITKINQIKAQQNQQNQQNNQNLTQSLQVIQPTQSSINNHKLTNNLLLQSSHYQPQNDKQIVKQKRSPKLKIKKTDNFQEYYFKAQTKNSQSSGLGHQTETKNSLKNKLIKPLNLKQYQTATSPQMQKSPSTKQFYEAQYRTSKLVPQVNSSKNIKSLSPSVKFSLHSPYRTGKFGSKFIQQNKLPTNVFSNNEQNNRQQIMTLNRAPNTSKIFSSSGDSKLKLVNQLPIEPQSSGMSTPKNIHQFISDNNPSIIIQNRGKSKLKVYSQSPRSGSPQQNNVIQQHWFPSQNSDRKGSFINNLIPQNNMKPLNRPPSSSTNNIFFPSQSSAIFTPTNSNLLNQSGFTNNIQRVIKYGPNIGFNQQISNRPSSILSTHSNQTKQKIIIGRSSQQLMSPTQREMHMMMGPSTTNIVVNNSPRFINVQNQQNSSINEQKMLINNNNANMNNNGQIRGGLNMMGGNYIMNNVHQLSRQSPNNSLTKLNQNQMIRPKKNVYNINDEKMSALTLNIKQEQLKKV